MDLDKLKKALELAKASLETKKIPKVDSDKLEEKGGKKMKTAKHMNGTNVDQYNHEGENMLNLEVNRVAGSEVVKYDSNGQWNIEKSNYGPKDMKLYNPTDNIKRKAKNTGEEFDDIGQNKKTKKYTTSGSKMSQAHEKAQQKKYDKEAKSNVKTYSKEEIAAMNEARMKKEEGLKVAPEGSTNRKTYLKEFKKSDIEISEWDDGVIEVDFYDENSAEVDYLANKLEEAGYEELEKKESWTPKAKHKSKKGGLTAAGRKSYNKKTGGNLKAPQPGGGPRKRSFCARNKGQIDMHNIDCKKDPDKRACKARRRWKC